MSTVLAVVSGMALIVVATASAVAAGHALAVREWRDAAVSAVLAFGLLAALFGALLTSQQPVERAITTQAEEFRCTCTRREP